MILNFLGLALEVRILPARPEDLNSVPSSHVRWLMATCSSSFGGFDALFRSAWALAHRWQTFTDTHTHVYRKSYLERNTEHLNEY